MDVTQQHDQPPVTQAIDCPCALACFAVFCLGIAAIAIT